MACTPAAAEALLRRTLSRRRRSHCRSVARLAAALCRRFGVDPRQGAVAVLARVFGYLEQSGKPVAKSAIALYDELGEQAHAQAKVG